MRLLQKLWFRVVISLLAGGMTNEIIFLLTGDPTRHRSPNDSNFSIIYAIIIFLILTLVVNKFARKTPF